MKKKIKFVDGEIKFLKLLPVSTHGMEVTIGGGECLGFKWWNSEEDHLHIQINDAGEIYFSDLFLSRSTSGTLIFKDEIPKEILDYIARFKKKTK